MSGDVLLSEAPVYEFFVPHNGPDALRSFLDAAKESGLEIEFLEWFLLAVKRGDGFHDALRHRACEWDI